MASVVSKLMSLVRKRGWLLLAASIISALIAAKAGNGGIQYLGYWDGPS